MTTQPARSFRMTPLRRIGDTAFAPLIRIGALPSTYLLTTRGRRTGKPRTNPVALVEHDGRRWLVAPYGAVSWVLNARAAGRVTLQRRGRTLECAVRELGPHEAAPILKEYLHLSMAGPPHRYFLATQRDPVEKFEAEAAAHPVFELTELKA